MDTGIPRIVVAAPASGHGKTTVVTGLLAALRAQGHRPAGFKVGPDYIDPSYHALACGRPGRNLDPVLVGAHLVAPLFVHGAAGADIAIVEGVMGLYDGRTHAGAEGSTAQVASLIDAPVVLVVDVAAQGRSVAALVHGFRSFDGAPRLAGVILNRVGSDRHEAIVREALEEVGTPVLGVLRRSDAVATPSRHLGLVPAVERQTEAEATVRALAGLVASAVDLDAVVAAARTAGPLTAPAWAPPATAPVPGRRPLVAVAGGPAFSFSYTETVELLQAAGADVTTVDPIEDEALPAGTDALVVGGGFPEIYAGQLAANAPLRAQVAALAARNAPIAAECAGLLWLGRSLDGAPMCGVLPADAMMTKRLAIGYRDAVALSPSWLADPGTRVTGHEFHRTELVPTAGSESADVGGRGISAAAWAWAGNPGEGFVAGNVHASYLHLHWAGHPDAARRLVAACR
jgi:cobyrinic acid a,c-diamide synthase